MTTRIKPTHKTRTHINQRIDHVEVNIGNAGDLLDPELVAEGRRRHNDLVAVLKLLHGVGQVRALPGVTGGKLDHQTVHEFTEDLGVHILEVGLVPGHLGTLGEEERLWWCEGGATLPDC